MAEPRGPRLVALELQSPEDLFRLASLLPAPFVNYSADEGVVFIPLGGLSRAGTVYFARVGGELRSRFAHVNRLRGTVSFGDEASLEPNVVNVEIIRVKSHNVPIPRSK
ncbi:MAG: hypothetical protein ABDH63_03990 [Candidatus Caldarchaeales archaeon]